MPGLTPGPGGQNLYALASVALVATGNSGDISVADFDAINIDFNASAVTGTTPSLTLTWQRKGADGVYYTLWTATALTAAGSASITIGKGYGYLSGTNIPAGIGGVGRLVWTITGTTPSFTSTASVTSA